MHSRGFNLFTALVSFLMIGLAVLLANSMTTTEAKQADQLAFMQEKANLQATADLARADAIQSFNYVMRERIENFITNQSFGPTELSFRNVDGSWKAWDDVQKGYAESQFGTDPVRCQSPDGCGAAFAYFLSNGVQAYFTTGSRMKGYSISLETVGGNDDLRKQFQAIVYRTVVNNPDPNQKFLEPLECRESDCPLGTFYVNFDVRKLSDEEYALLPLIKVVDNATGTSVKIPLLARVNYKIYVPVRLFKAIWLSRQLSGGSSGQSTGGPSLLLSPEVHNTIDAMRLGFCDPNSCVPRYNPFEAVDPSLTKLGNKSANSACTTGIVNNFPLRCKGSGSIASVFCPSSMPASSYDATKTSLSGASTDDSMNVRLKKIVEDGMHAVLKTKLESGDLFSASPGSDPNAFDAQGLRLSIANCSDASAIGSTGTFSKCVSAVVVSTFSKALISNFERVDLGDEAAWTGTVVVDAAKPALGGTPTNPCAYSGSLVPPGAFLDGSTIRNVDPNYRSYASCSGSPSQFLRCAEVSQIDVYLSFTETSTGYSVLPRSSAGNQYQFKVSDFFHVFNPAVVAQSGPDGACLVGRPVPNACSFDTGGAWACKNVAHNVFGAPDRTECRPAA